MTTAVATPPIRKGKAKQEVDTANMEIQQKDSFELPPLGEPLERPTDIVTLPHGAKVTREEAEMLAFMDEPVKIMVHHATGDRPSPWTDYIANNGIPAQVLMTRDGYSQDLGSGKWIGYGYFPRGIPLVTKRKFLEELAKSKQDVIETEIVDRESQQPRNIIHRRTSAKFPFQVLEDRNPKGTEWLHRVMYQG